MARSTFDQRKEEILEAAITVFSRDGYHRVTTADISSEVGISQPYIYRFYKSKDELFLAAVDRVYGRIANAFRTVTSGPDFERRLIVQYERLMNTHPREIILQVQTWGIQEESIRSRVASALVGLIDTVEQAFAREGLPDPRTRAEDFLARGVLCNLAHSLGAEGLYRSRGA